MAKRPVLRYAIIALILAALGAGGYYLLKNGKAEPVYKTEPAGRGDIEAVVTATGTANAVITVSVGTQVSGTIQKIYADFNSVVKQGQIIAQIDPTLYQAQLDQSRAALLTARANLQKAVVAQRDAERTMGRNRQMIDAGLIAQADYDAAALANDTAVAQVDAAKAQVAQAEGSVATANTNLRYTRITSPVDGTVISRNVDAGQTVAASFQTPTLYSIAHDLTKMQIDSNVAEADIGRVEAGQDVEFTVDAYPDRTFHGTIYEVRNAPLVVQNVVTYNAVVRVDNPDLKLKPGMTANVTIKVMKKAGVIRLPNAALRYVPSKQPTQQAGGGKGTRGGGKAVWVLRDNAPVRVPVTLGISDSRFTELVSGELKEGDQLIVEEKALGGNSGSAAPRLPRGF